MNKFFKINDALPDLIAGIVLYGLAAQFIPVWFLEHKIYYSVGLWIGILAAAFAAWHMAYTIENAVDYGESGAVKMLQKSSALRYGVFLLVLGILMIFNFASPIAAFVGMMSLKVSAYLAPFTHKIIRR